MSNILDNRSEGGGKGGPIKNAGDYSIINCVCHWNHMCIHNEKATTRELEDIFLMGRNDMYCAYMLFSVVRILGANWFKALRASFQL